MFTLIVTLYMVFKGLGIALAATSGKYVEGSVDRSSRLLSPPLTSSHLLSASSHLLSPPLTSSPPPRYVGRGEPTRVPTLCAIATALALAFAAILGGGMYALRSPIAQLLSRDAAVDRIIRTTILGPVLSLPGYSVLTTLYGACKEEQGSNPQPTI